MLKGSKPAVVQKVQPVSIHGQVSYDVYYLEPDDLQGQVRIARVGKESMPRSLEAGDNVIVEGQQELPDGAAIPMSAAAAGEK